MKIILYIHVYSLSAIWSKGCCHRFILQYDQCWYGTSSGGWNLRGGNLHYTSHHPACLEPEGFVRGGPTLTKFFFLVYEGWVTTISGPTSPTCKRPLKWHFASWPMMAQH